MKYKLLILPLFVSVVGFSQVQSFLIVRNDSMFAVWVIGGDSTFKHLPSGTPVPIAITGFVIDTMRNNVYDRIMTMIQNNSTEVGRNFLNIAAPATSSLARVDASGNVVLRSATLAKQDLQLENVTNESKATMFTSPTFTGSPIFPNSVITNANLEGSIDLTTKVTGTLPFINGGISGAVATSATTGAMTVNMTSRIITITPTGACTFNGSGGVTGQITTFIITTSGTSSFVMTWGTNFRKVGTLATGTTSARFFSVSFICTNGVLWQEISRTAAQQ